MPMRSVIPLLPNLRSRRRACRVVQYKSDLVARGQYRTYAQPVLETMGHQHGQVVPYATSVPDIA
eukprot:1090563-Rhodomonas_salina.2